MMRSLYFIFLLAPAIVFSQNLEEQLQGTWMCIGIVDSTGNLSEGEIGGPANYLKFQFEGKKLFISLAPFDKGSGNRIEYKQDYFKLINTSFKQNRYKVSTITNEALVLETVTRNNKRIFYHFVNSSKYSKDLDQVSNFREYEKLILKITYSRAGLGFYIGSYYLIDNSVLNLLPGPIFIDERFLSFGYYLSENFRLSLASMLIVDGKDTAIEFDVTNHGLENISIVKRLGDEVDFQLYDLIKQTSKKWQPLEINGKIIDIRIRLNISFSYAEE